MATGAFRDTLALRINQRLFYGWIVLLVAALGYFASGPGQSHLFGVFITPISEDLGISRTAISTAYATATLIAAFGLPYVGRLVDRFGARRVALVVVIVLGFASIGFGQVTGVITLGLGFMLLRFLGQGSLMLTCQNMTAQWFDRQRGFALSLMSLGFFLSVAVHPPLMQWLIALVGWREAWVWLGVATWILLLPAIYVLVQNKPEDLGLEPDPPRGGGLQIGPRISGSANIGFTAAEALRTPAFWIIAISLSTLSMLVTALFFHQVSIFESHGLSAGMAAGVFSIAAISAVIAVPVFGRLLDRFRARPIFATGMLSMSLTLIALVFVQGFWSAFVYSVIFGVANAVIHSHMAFLWPRYFGRKHLGQIQGTATTIAVVGASVGPIPFGAAYDLFGSYTGALLLFALQPVFCAALILFMKPPDLQAHAAAQAAKERAGRHEEAPGTA
ncbi:MAG TPA: MFS transporter [Geminicoccaceae bacterium]